jgi:hypothetical protein
MIRSFSGKDPVLSKLFACDFLMTTIIGLLVTESRFLVFYSGNGVIAVNGDIVTLVDEEQNHRYIAKDLFPDHTNHKTADSPPENRLRVFSSGCTSTLASVFLATDGLADLAAKQSDALKEFASYQPPPDQITNGFDFLLQEFRQRIAWNPDLAPPLNDDATFLMLRRISKENV